MARKKIGGTIFAVVSNEFAAIEEKLPEVAKQALEDVAEGVEADVQKAITPGNLPAGGKYSNGELERARLKGGKATYDGTYAEIGIGFDKTVYSPSSWLITGTPKMRPDMALNVIFRGTKYQKSLKKELQFALNGLCREEMS